MPEAATLFKECAGYLKPDDISQLQSAYQFSESAHHGQFRDSGEPYISHPLAVAGILAKWHLDSQALTAALLHDVMEDTAVTKNDLLKTFGKPVAELVDGVSKLDKVEFETRETAQAENFRKMLLAMARDVRVILIKLADRLHNMRTLDAVPANKRRRIARETLDIYAPIANRLGLNSIYQELEDLSFQYLYPARCRVLSKAVAAARGNRREVVGKVLAAIEKRLRDSGLSAQVQGRQKHLYSIYTKMREKHLSFAQVLDVYGFRIVVKDVHDSYVALGVLHGLYKPIPGKFKDYIAIPKANGYQSLHTHLFGPFGSPIEIQIRTQEMHKIAEAGVASHWLYKSSDQSISDLQQKTHQWLQSLLEMQSESGDSVEFLEHLKVDLFPDEVYVFTPKGKIMALPRGATAVDFAYAVHTDVGNRCVAVKINQELMPLRTELKNGDRVEVITASHAKPNPLWLNFVGTAKARSHIRHFLKTMHFDESVQLGERLLNQALSAFKSNISAVPDQQWKKLVRDSNAKSRKDILSDIGLGKRHGVVVARQLLALREPVAGDPGEHLGMGPIVIRGSEGMAVQFSKCCHPIPGDRIVGLISKGQGMAIHTHDCPVLAKSHLEPERVLDVEWDNESQKMHDVNVRVIVANERGVLAQVAARIADAESNIQNVAVEPQDGGKYASMQFTLQVTNRQHLARIMIELRRIPEVARISRVR
ncbi:MAG TPA: bifunctional (p)ppGpp synthetase/guanosine-3',5'-bis(diphosphate) 3'-pyrophosphohydrolase [Burkholderiales bacterium]|nr:bifunctional (p)ppGpp synthetase/guanosine-3',5'-bis(diphosphate) 3'-pyrophosphohydrolase [Burkholderiales bacterium]